MDPKQLAKMQMVSSQLELVETGAAHTAVNLGPRPGSAEKGTSEASCVRLANHGRRV